MEKEKIERAAKEYADKHGDFCTGGYHAVDDFIHGARWRINSVWHAGEAKCDRGRKALVLFKNGNAAVYKDLRDLWTGRDNLWPEVDKFAYLNDLLPDTRKEAEP